MIVFMKDKSVLYEHVLAKSCNNSESVTSYALSVENNAYTHGSNKGWQSQTWQRDLLEDGAARLETIIVMV